MSVHGNRAVWSDQPWRQPLERVFVPFVGRGGGSGSGGGDGGSGCGLNGLCRLRARHVTGKGIFYIGLK